MVFCWYKLYNLLTSLIFKKYKLIIIKTKTFTVVFVAFNLFVIAGFCSASTIFSDNFNSYVDGNLGGQGGWIGGLSETVIQDSTVFEGAKAVNMHRSLSGTTAIQKSGALINDGKITIYIRRHIGGTTNPAFNIFLKEGTNSKIEFKTGGINFRYWNGSSYVNFGPSFLSDTWFALQIQWRSSDHKARYRINDGSFTDWQVGLADWSLGLDTVKINLGNGAGFVDTIQENLIGEKDPVIVIPGILGSAEKDGQWVIDPILHVYDNLIDSFKANGYVQNETLFTLPYDWHQSNIDTAIELKNKIGDIKEICDCQKVDIVGHSMGGLIARQYIQSSDYQNDVDQLLFLGTPHLGSPKDYLTWEGGVITTDNDIGSRMFKRIYQNEARQNGYNNIFDYIRNKPIYSVQELLPIYNYLVDSNPLAVRQYPENYPTNSFLENLNDNISTLNSSGVEIHNIIGDSEDNSTVSFIRVVPSEKLPLWEHGYPEGFDENVGDRGLSLGEGDGTVPDDSSDIFSDSISVNSDHISLTTNAQLDIFNALLGEGQYTTIDNFNFPNLKLLIVKLFSPVDMQIVAPSGKRIGKDFATGQEINEIQYAFYSGFETNDEYITILNPEEGNYEIITQGTDNGGEYTISSALISDNDILEYDFTAHTTTNQIENLNLSLTDGEIEVIPEDITPPEITINSPQNQDYLHSEMLNINYSITDDSGVFSSLSELDTIEVDNGQSIDLFYKSLGNHNFTVEARDNVNNQSSASINFRVIATVDSTISDINRAYELGWIVKESTKDDLIKRINKATKLIKRINELEEKLNNKPKVLKKIQKMEKKLDIKLDKFILNNLTALQNDGVINEEAYNLIYANINWLINN